MTSADLDSDPVDAPLQGLTKENHGPWVVVCAYIFILLTLMTIFIKLFTRFRSTNHLTANDCFILTAEFLGFAQTITITIAVHFGLGQRRKALSDSKFESFEKTMYASNILLILVLAAAKASVTHLIITINPTHRLLLSCYGILGFVSLWALASVLALAFQCSLPHPWDFEDNRCVDQFALNAGIHAVNILSDVLIVLVPFTMMLKVPVSRNKRFIVTGSFALRLVVPVFTVTMLVYLQKMFHSSHPDPTWDYVVPQIFAQIMLNSSIIASCIPSLKRFLADIKPGLIVVNVPEDGLTASYVRHTRSRSRAKSRLSRPGAGIFRLSSKFGFGGHGGHALASSSSGSSSVLWREKQEQALTTMELGYNRPQATKASSKVEIDRSESIEGLTDDVIMHSIDYKVEYEDAAHDPDVVTDQSSGSPRRTRE
ncbi:hypothetical protein A1O3_00056 [Capronia epimyces CBS 606.96]|uniref:Rhodopsin domain-containing protein n=1 Tax=Capronia epimyces CBS 606.96 TaxID=1182542 RepID=W9YG48_9EURO|nr:uncharacterized protein A1O3_00056 [Capronia epimyces CBS 606.96]EXJ91508.1 hypothetical protein A1O3_00056 [Capronia epimyces CBS 606.96]